MKYRSSELSFNLLNKVSSHCSVDNKYPDDHDKTWERLVRKCAPMLPEEYTAYPRGRIVYHINDQRFLVYMNRKHIKDTKIKKS